MERTRSGRTVKRSSKFLEMEDEFDDEPLNRREDEDGDFNFDDDNNSDDESFEEEHINYRDDSTPRSSGRTRRTYSKGFSQELIWKDGKLVTAPNSQVPVIHQLPIEKPRPKLKAINDIEEIVQGHDAKGTRFYTGIFEALNKPNFNYPKLLINNHMESVNYSLPPLDLINDAQFKLKLETKNQSLMLKTTKTIDKIKDVVGVDINLEELERYTRVSGYILYNIVTKKKFENQIPDNQSYRKMQETWATMPDRNKRDWEIKVKQIKKFMDNKRRNEIIEDSAKKEKRRLAMKKAEENIKKTKLEDHNMVDLACYLKAAGDGMTKLSNQIASYQGPIGIVGVESVLMDYLMCTIIPLIGIFEGSEGLDRQITTDSLNKLTFLMPGMN